MLLSSQKYITKGYVYDFLHPWLHQGLLTSGGKLWYEKFGNYFFFNLFICKCFRIFWMWKSLWFRFLENILCKIMRWRYLLGEKWQKRRKILTPAFHFNILREFCNVFVENSERLVQQLEKVVNQEIDVLPFITNFTLNSICGEFLHIPVGACQRSRRYPISHSQTTPDRFNRWPL